VRRGPFVVVLLVCGLTLLLVVPRLTASCDKEEEPAHQAATTGAPPLPPPGPNLVTFTIAEDGKTAIDMPAPREHITAETTAASGTLQIDLSDLAGSRGAVLIDLSTLKTRTFSQADKNNRADRARSRVARYRQPGLF
jgi:hypothetical protein